MLTVLTFPRVEIQVEMHEEIFMDNIQIISLLGSIQILAAYIGVQTGKLESHQRLYSLLNFFGSAILTYVGIVENNYGFILLEGVWALVSLWALFRPRAGRTAH